MTLAEFDPVEHLTKPHIDLDGVVSLRSKFHPSERHDLPNTWTLYAVDIDGRRHELLTTTKLDYWLWKFSYDHEPL